MTGGGEIIRTISEGEKFTMKILNQLEIWDDDWLSLPSHIEISYEQIKKLKANKEWYNLACLQYKMNNYKKADWRFLNFFQEELEKGSDKDQSFLYKCFMNYIRCNYLEYNGPQAPLHIIEHNIETWQDISDEYHDKIILCAIVLAITDEYRNTMALPYFGKFRNVENFYKLINNEYSLEKYFVLLADKLISRCKYEKTPSIFFKDQLLDAAIENSYTDFALKLSELNYLDAKENKDKNRIMESFNWELKVYDKKNDYKSAAERSKEMAEFLLDRFDDEEGYLEYMKKAISFFEKSDNPDELLETIETLLDFYSKQNNLEDAKEYYRKAAGLYLDLEELEKAAELYEKAGIKPKTQNCRNL